VGSRAHIPAKPRCQDARRADLVRVNGQRKKTRRAAGCSPLWCSTAADSVRIRSLPRREFQWNASRFCEKPSAWRSRRRSFWKKQRKINGKSDPWAAMNWTLWQRSCQTFSRSDRTAEIIVGGLAGATSAWNEYRENAQGEPFYRWGLSPPRQNKRRIESFNALARRVEGLSARVTVELSTGCIVFILQNRPGSSLQLSKLSYDDVFHTIPKILYRLEGLPANQQHTPSEI